MKVCAEKYAEPSSFSTLSNDTETVESSKVHFILSSKCVPMKLLFICNLQVLERRVVIRSWIYYFDVFLTQNW